MFACFFLTINVSYGTLCLIGMHSAAASILTKFLYLTFRVSFSDIS